MSDLPLKELLNCTAAFRGKKLLSCQEVQELRVSINSVMNVPGITNVSAPVKQAQLMESNVSLSLLPGLIVAVVCDGLVRQRDLTTIQD